MEQKIRTYEGEDCIQQLEELRRLFPRFKRAYINRIFTRNMLNFDITYHHLKREDDMESEKCAKIKLIHTPKVDEAKRGKCQPILYIFNMSVLSVTDLVFLLDYFFVFNKV